MKHIIILGDGMADHPLPSLGGRTLLQAAHTPWMDLLAREGRCGRLITVPPGFHPGSEVANMSVLGYDLPSVYEGRGVLEAASMGVDLAPGELAMRCNLVCIEEGKIKNHSAGHITTAEADELIRFLRQELGSERIHFHAGVQYRHLLVLGGGGKELDTTPPHDVPGQPFRPLLPKALAESARPTAELLCSLILRSQELLENHPVNQRRAAAGLDKANSIWPWSPGYRPQMELLSSRFPQVRRGSVISAVDLIRGIGRYAGLRSIEVPGATGLYDTNYEGKASAAIEALRSGDDFVFLHVEASDEAGHEGDAALKQRTIEDLDARIVGPVFREVSQWTDEPVAMAVLPDHPTPCALRTHVGEPVPFLIYYPGIEPDDVDRYDEASAVGGSYGLMKEDEFIREFMKH